MPIDAHLQIRDAGSWDMPLITELARSALAPTPFGPWLDAHGGHRHTSASVTDLLQRRAGVVGRMLVDDGALLGAALWTWCAGPTHREDVDQPAEDQRAEAGWLRTTLIQVHPAGPHRHLRLVVVDSGRRRQGIGTALLADQPPDCVARYAVLPQTLAAAAARADYQAVGFPIRVPSAGLLLQPFWHAGRRSTAPDNPYL